MAEQGGQGTEGREGWPGATLSFLSHIQGYSELYPQCTGKLLGLKNGVSLHPSGIAMTHFPIFLTTTAPTEAGPVPVISSQEEGSCLGFIQPTGLPVLEPMHPETTESQALSSVFLRMTLQHLAALDSQWLMKPSAFWPLPPTP